MGKLINWFMKLSKNQKIAILVPLGVALISGITKIIVAEINKRDSPSPHSPPIISRHHEVERINNEISEYLKEIDNKTESDIDEKQRLINIVFDYIKKSINIDEKDGETYFLYAEALLRNSDHNKNYEDALSNYDNALTNNYYFEGDIHFGYGYIYESMGDRDLTKFDFSSSEVHYKSSIYYLTKIINDQKLSFYKNDVNKVKGIITRVEQKKEICKYDEIFRKAFSPDINLIPDYDVYSGMEELAKSFTEKRLWKNATLCYYWLFNQNNITGQRRKKDTESLRYVSERWEYSDDFVQEITNNSVNGIVDSNNVNIREDHAIDDENIIRELNIYENLKVLRQSNFKQSIGNVNAYWYKVYTDDGIEGWIYGQHLIFYPIYPSQ